MWAEFPYSVVLHIANQAKKRRKETSRHALARDALHVLALRLAPRMLEADLPHTTAL